MEGGRGEGLVGSARAKAYGDFLGRKRKAHSSCKMAATVSIPAALTASTASIPIRMDGSIRDKSVSKMSAWVKPLAVAAPKMRCVARRVAAFSSAGVSSA